jgi:hypothetical protein
VLLWVTSPLLEDGFEVIAATARILSPKWVMNHVSSETAPLQYGGSVMIASTEAEACRTLLAGRRRESP